MVLFSFHYNPISMKKLFLPITLFCMLGVSTLIAQITITQANFPRSAQFTDSVTIASPTGVVLPAHGAGQTWDYGNLVSSSLSTTDYFDATSDPNFPGALNYRPFNLVFQALPINSNLYEAIDANGFFELGRTIDDATYSIAGTSGGANDSLRFVGGNYIFPGRINALKFPLTYPNQWTESNEQNIDFEITVAGFGLNQAPGQNKAYHTQHREVVGYGTLVIPVGSTPSLPISVLLIKVVHTRMDSFFLGGNPAPAPLMAAFGLNQGDTEVDSFYVFYTENFGAPVLNIGISGSSASYAAYRSKAGTANPVNRDALISMDNSVYPNPIKAGNILTIKVDIISTVTISKIFDVNGCIVHEQNVSEGANQLLVSLPETIPPGVYIISLEEGNGNILTRNRISIY
jgi:hypothetical protein